MLSPLGLLASDLKIGMVCFSVAYVDRAHRIPVVESFVFIGTNLGGEADGSLYFQDVESFQTGGALTSLEQSPTETDTYVMTTGPKPPPNLFGYDGLLDELGRCRARALIDP
jgi:hypothetical protein